MKLIKNVILGAVLTCGLSATAFALLTHATLTTVNQSNIKSFQYDAQTNTAAFDHKPANPYNGNGTFTISAYRLGNVATIILYPAEHPADKCELYFWDNGYAKLLATPSQGYKCVLTHTEAGTNPVLTFKN